MPTSVLPKPPLTRAYTLKVSKIPDYFGVLLGNPIPEVFDTAFLAKSGFRYAIDRTFIDILAGLGFLTEAGQPTRRYADFHGRRLSGTVLRQGLADAYAGLLAELPNAAVCPEREIMETVSRYFQGEINDMAACGIAATFLALTRYAASLDNGAASADAAQQPAVTPDSASRPASSPPGANGPATASKPAAAPHSGAAPAAAPELTAAPTSVAAGQPEATPKPEAASGSVAAGSPAVAVAPVAAPEPVAQEQAASLQAAPAPKAGAHPEAFAPTTAEATSAPVAPAPEPVAPTASVAASLAAAPASAVTKAPTPAKDMETAARPDAAPGIVIEAFPSEARGSSPAAPKHPTIHITLPASTDEAVYDAIFASLKRHLLSPGENA
ncbi:DUF5343 domain-containing protein [Solidesulfovibrio magneticus]|nr:DUF5343 domain-containing protein [Solidesulfovibrio magneticus]